MSAGEGSAAEEEVSTSRLRYRIAFFVASLVVLGLLVTLPFSVKSVVDDVFGSVTGRVIKLTRGWPETARPNHTKLHLAFVGLDETQLLASIRVSGHHRCVECNWSDRVLFVAVTADDLDADGMPPSVGVTLAQANAEISEVIQLPLRGSRSTIRSTATASSSAWFCSACAGTASPRRCPPPRPAATSSSRSRSCSRGRS